MRGSVFSVFASLVATAWLIGCDCEGGDATAPDVNPGVGLCAGPSAPAGCGTACDSLSNFCPTGLYCQAGACTADCDAQNPCVGGTCTASGRCLINRFDASITPASDASTGVCADITVGTNRTIPTVVLIIDQSGSMDASLSGGGGPTRWNALRSSLLAQPGLIFDLQASVRFGLALYTAELAGNGSGAPASCPDITSVPPALNNYSAIASVYNAADAIDETPTGDSIDAILATLNTSGPDPTIFILATDGDPDRCEQANPNNMADNPQAYTESIQAVTRAFNAGIKTYIISVGAVSRSHLDEMANAGQGLPISQTPPAQSYEPSNATQLETVLTQIVRGEVTCNLTVAGRLNLARACDGSVILNGNPLPCNGANGWRPLSETEIELTGSACETLLTDPAVTLTATFPCDAVTLI